jgi:hypothetical protein
MTEAEWQREDNAYPLVEFLLYRRPPGIRAWLSLVQTYPGKPSKRKLLLFDCGRRRLRGDVSPGVEQEESRADEPLRASLSGPESQALEQAKWCVPLKADVLRDIFGNPFRSVGVESLRSTEDVLGLARAMYDERNFDRMPILGDILEAAGCADAAILGHCRGPGPHVRGCWVVDLVLGKQ